MEPQGLEALLIPVAPRHQAKHKAEKRNALEDGVRDVLCGFHSDAVPDRAERTKVGLPVSCRGTRGKEYSSGWSSGCMSAGSAER